MVKRRMFIYPFIKYFHRANLLIYKSKDHFAKVGSGIGSHDPKNMLVKYKSNIKFTHKENEKGYDYLKKIGMQKKDRFICFNIRDGAYKNKYHNFHDWDYTKHRNSEIDKYKESAITLAKKGYWVFRMGKEVEKVFNISHPKIIDYAKTSLRNDFLDIWLNANCFFSVCTASGMAEICKVFIKPIVFVNFIPICDFQFSKMTYYLPKSYKWKKNNSFLSLREIIETGVINFDKNEHYENNGIEIVDNSSEDIKEAVLEMEAKLNNKWVDIKEDAKYQKDFQNKFKTWHFYKKFFVDAKNPVLSSTFLRKNHNWFLN